MNNHVPLFKFCYSFAPIKNFDRRYLELDPLFKHNATFQELYCLHSLLQCCYLINQLYLASRKSNANT